MSTGQESSNEVTEGVVQTDGTPEKEGAKEDEEGNPVLEVVNVDSPKTSNSPDNNEKTIALTRAGESEWWHSSVFVYLCPSYSITN